LRRVADQVEIQHPNVEVAASPSRISPVPILTIRAIVRRERIEVLHCHLFRAQVFGCLLKMFFFPGIVLIFHEHGRVVGREGESWLEAFVFRVFLKATRRYVDRYICNGEYTRARLLNVVPSIDDRAIAVSNPIATHSGAPAREDVCAWRNEAGIPPGTFVVGFAARLIRTKGWREFLQAMQLIRPHAPLFFLIAGEGEDRAKIEACILELGLETRGRLLGYVSRMDRFYPLLDCFVLPSRWESHGLSHLEAQSYGVPIVVSNVSGLNATVHSEADALLFDVGDAAALAGQILRIANDASLRARLGRSGLANAAAYTVESFALKMDQIYLEARKGIICAREPLSVTPRPGTSGGLKD
jgi:glycosyltransferase involved in cell wall biosynthesis